MLRFCRRRIDLPRSYQQTKSRQIVDLSPHSFLLLESAMHVEYRKSADLTAVWLPSCPNGNKARTTVSPAAGSLWLSVGNGTSSNFAPLDAGGTTIRERNSSMRCAKCCIFAPNGRGLRLAGQRANRLAANRLATNRFATNRFATKHQTKRSIQARCRRTRRKAVVARRAWPAALARVGDLGRRSGASLTRWT